MAQLETIRRSANRSRKRNPLLGTLPDPSQPEGDGVGTAHALPADLLDLKELRYALVHRHETGRLEDFNSLADILRRLLLDLDVQ